MLAMISKWEVQEFQSVRVNDSLERHPCVRLKVQIDSFLLRVIFLCQAGSGSPVGLCVVAPYCGKTRST